MTDGPTPPLARPATPPPLPEAPVEVGEQLAALQELVRDQSQRISRLEASIEQAVHLLLLPEADRAAFAQHKRYEQFQELSRQVDLLLASGQVGDVGPLETRLRETYGSEEPAQQLLQRITEARHREAAAAIDALTAEVESLMAMTRWDDAFAEIDALSQRFPGDVTLINLASRVHREYQGWRESVTTHLYDQVKIHVDRRDWQSAVRHAEELVARFADHPRAHRVAQQLPTLRNNAEILARQELEQRMQQLIRSRRYDEAIVLGEQIVRDYPKSPQAAECRALLPRLEQLALQHETEGEHSPTS